MTRRYQQSLRVHGRRVYTLLYRRWRDMRGRTRGYATKRPDLYADVECAWQTFDEFRTWALAHGFSKPNNSPDRENILGHYEPGNVRFVPPAENSARALGRGEWRDEC